MGRMLGNDCPVGLLRHDKSKKVFTHLIVSVRLKLNRRVFYGRRTNVVASNRFGFSALNGHTVSEARAAPSESKILDFSAI
jgi:hypothetical protein